LIIMQNAKLRAGLALYGSALDRHHLDDFLRDAGLHMNSAYRTNSQNYRVELVSDGIKDDIEVLAVRPECVPEELWAIEKDSGSDGLDIGIMGADIAAEGKAAGYPVRMLGSLGMGKVDIVCAVPRNSEYRDLGSLLRRRHETGVKTVGATEYYKYQAAEHIANNPVYIELYGESKPMISVGGQIISGDNPNVVVKFSEGKTEIMCISGFAQFMVENTQSGGTLTANDYRVLEKLGESWYRLYAGPHIKENGSTSEKWEHAMLVRDLLVGKAVGARYVHAEFDFSKNDEDRLMRYMEERQLFTVRPFVAYQNGKCETKILVPRRKVADIIRGLKIHGAEAVETTPVEMVTGLGFSDEELQKMVETPI
jgi:ATP phosphoribosyltransferase